MVRSIGTGINFFTRDSTSGNGPLPEEELMFSWPLFMNNQTSALNGSFKGTVIVPDQNFKITGISAYINIFNAGVYKAGVYSLDATDKVDGIIDETQEIAGLEGKSPGVLSMTVNADLLAEQTYFIAVGRTDTSTTHKLPITEQIAPVANTLTYPNIPLIPFAIDPTVSNNNGVVDSLSGSTSPIIGTQVVVQTLSSFGIGMEFLL